MKKIILLILVAGVYKTTVAQWCVPTTLIPYNANMPGITHFTLNTIDRSSLDCENYPNNSYVNTGMSTELVVGQTYSVSITFTIDPQVCPDMNLRVWIDYNQDYQLDDQGETVLSADNQLPGTYTGTFTVPSNATPGITRLRATAKMTSTGGHSLPTPCDNPADPWGYHGEMEDYDIHISTSTGIQSAIQQNNFHSYADKEYVYFSLNASNANIILYNGQGKLTGEINNANSGVEYKMDRVEYSITPGIYFATLIYDNKREVVKIFCE